MMATARITDLSLRYQDLDAKRGPKRPKSAQRGQNIHCVLQSLRVAHNDPIEALEIPSMLKRTLS